MVEGTGHAAVTVGFRVLAHASETKAGNEPTSSLYLFHLWQCKDRFLADPCWSSVYVLNWCVWRKRYKEVISECIGHKIDAVPWSRYGWKWLKRCSGKRLWFEQDLATGLLLLLPRRGCTRRRGGKRPGRVHKTSPAVLAAVGRVFEPAAGVGTVEGASRLCNALGQARCKGCLI